MKPTVVIEETKEKIAANLAEDVMKIIINKKEDIHIALSGGNTPKALYQYIAENFSEKVNWNKVYFWWGDERCVPQHDDDSNYKMAKETLLDPLKISNYNIIRIKGEIDPIFEVKELNQKVKNKIPFKDSLPVFDIIFLGLGEDGHTVSIFPDQIELFNSSKIYEVAVHPVTKQKRITLTGKVINNAKNIFFFITGSSKAKVIKEILNREGNYKSYPASLIAPKDGNLKWYLDKLAAEKL